MKYLVFPMEYDPVTAAGLPDAWYLKIGCAWTEKDVAYHRELAKQAVWQETAPSHAWFMRFAETADEVEQLRKEGHKSPNGALDEPRNWENENG